MASDASSQSRGATPCPRAGTLTKNNSCIQSLLAHKMLFMTDVLIAGAGLGGTSAAMFLSQRGVQVQVVERHAGTSPHPRASGQNPRTMELLRSAGVAEQVLEAAGAERTLRIRVAKR